MKKIRFIVLIFISVKSWGQDPQFSQFFSSPLNVNPALTAQIEGDWRVLSNIRDQWVGPVSPYITGTISYDRKLFQKKYPNIDNSDDNFLGVGGMLMFDHAMNGVQKSSYATADIAYNIKLAQGNIGKHRLELGFGTTYMRRYVDFSRLYFQDQWIGYNGFNINLPTGEAALSNMKPFLSLSTGLVYTYHTDRSNWDIGVAAFHINTPKQTFIEDPHQHLAIRKVLHSNFEAYINDNVVFNFNSIFQVQQHTKYYSTGLGMGYFVGEDRNTLMNFGLWYWSKNAVIPYIGIVKGDMQIGISFDITVSKLRYTDPRPQTAELSIKFKGTSAPSGFIPCPWK